MIRPFHIAFVILCIAGFSLVSSCREKGNQQQAVDDARETTPEENSSQEQAKKLSTQNSASTAHFEEKEDSEPLAGSSDGVGVLDEVLKLWDQGQFKPAVEKFLHTNWEESAIFSETSNLALTDQEFASLPESERDAIQQDCLRLARVIRELVIHVLGLGKESLAAKNYGLSENYLNAVLDFGRALARPRSSAIMKAVGRGVERAALKELTHLYTRTGEQVKLEATHESLSLLP